VTIGHNTGQPHEQTLLTGVKSIKNKHQNKSRLTVAKKNQLIQAFDTIQKRHFSVVIKKGGLPSQAPTASGGTKPLDIVIIFI
jgi:hypothetical protein